MSKLGAGELFPSMSLALTGGGQISLPNVDSRYLVALFYRGHW